MSGTCVGEGSPTVRLAYSSAKVESAQLGNPLARFLHVNCDLSQGPWVWKRGQAMQ